MNEERDGYRCKACLKPVALSGDLILPGHQGFFGPGYLMEKMINVSGGPSGGEEHFLPNGVHRVFSVFCVGCQSYVGWRFVSATKQTEKYKNGKYMLERVKVYGPSEFIPNPNPIPEPITMPMPMPMHIPMPMPNEVPLPNPIPIPIGMPRPFPYLMPPPFPYPIPYQMQPPFPYPMRHSNPNPVPNPNQQGEENGDGGNSEIR